MNSEDTEAATLIRLLSVPGILALALLGIVVLATSRLLGADTIVREMITEVIAGFGNAILILAVFGLFFRSGLERLIRRAPGGDTIAESAEHLRELLGDFDQRGLDVEPIQLRHQTNDTPSEHCLRRPRRAGNQPRLKHNQVGDEQRVLRQPHPKRACRPATHRSQERVPGRGVPLRKLQ